MHPSNNKPCSQLRIGAVSYLNTKPLVYGLQDMLPNASLTFDLPSRLADQLAVGELDVALVPSIEFADHPEWSIISDACIGCRGPVLSVKIMFRVAPHEVKTLALDEGSRTSAVLAQILLNELYGVRPQLSKLPIGDSYREANADAVLVIGDRAIHDKVGSAASQQAAGDFVEVWDLGDRWCRWAERPFVFAMWLARPGFSDVELASVLSTARDRGCANLTEIAQRESDVMRMSESAIHEYLHRNLYFTLDRDQLAGLDLYYRHAAKLGLISHPPEVINDDCPIR
ncbi:MAG: menaquinone biosynthesis protein [Planctomycetota bacterium]